MLKPLLNLTLVCAILTFALANGQNKSKYSKEANVKPATPLSKGELDQKLKTLNPFRMHKFNLFWDKVKTADHLSKDQKAQLFAELRAHDEGEIELKHLKADGRDADGEIEAQLRHSFVEILKKFDLRNHLTPEMKTQYAKTEDKTRFDNAVKNKEKDEAKKLKSRASKVAEDKVDSLLKTAKESHDFDAEELRDLEAEMSHFADRRTEREMLFNDDDYHWEVEQKQLSKKANNERRKKDGNLEEQLPADVAGKGKTQDLHHPRVLKLWKSAQRSSFSAEELQELHVELKHFEVKLMKHESVNIQADNLKSQSTHGRGDKLYKEIHEKRQEMARGIKKMETYLENKIIAGKMEL